MTFNEYIYKNLGKSIDFDGVYGFQCCDLVNDYMQKCFNIFTYYPHNFNAQQYFTRFNEVSAVVKNFTKLQFLFSIKTSTNKVYVLPLSFLLHIHAIMGNNYVIKI